MNLRYKMANELMSESFILGYILKVGVSLGGDVSAELDYAARADWPTRPHQALQFERCVWAQS